MFWTWLEADRNNDENCAQLVENNEKELKFEGEMEPKNVHYQWAVDEKGEFRSRKKNDWWLDVVNAQLIDIQHS